ncbi:hypothetical protein [Streptomyces sp. NPDC050738]|uniref:hypothetical protein n=1 Tax=Streptomyces sp. NPDC050738 TaxID=3154744 RepID=UPI00343BC2BC
MARLLPSFMKKKRALTPAQIKQYNDSVAAAQGFLPAEQQNVALAAADPELEAALAAVAEGEWASAARLLAATGDDWDRRSLYVHHFGEAAGKGDAWLAAWHAARPSDPDAAVVQARATVERAWQVRGVQRGADTSSEQAQGFHQVLELSQQQIVRAAELNPRDPTPYVPEVWTALGLGYTHDEMLRLWSKITDRSPRHFDAHSAALQYWCAKWRGSEELAREFAAKAAAEAPAGSLLTALPLMAWHEHHRADATPEDYAAPQIMALVDAALRDADAAAKAPTPHPRLPNLRHLLAFFLAKQERYVEALEQFRLVDGYVAALPWRYFPDPAKAFCVFRGLATSTLHAESFTNGTAARP